MKEFEKSMESTFTELNEVNKKRDEFMEEHRNRMKEFHNELGRITSATSDLSEMKIANDEFIKEHQKIESDLDQMSKELDDLLNDDIFKDLEKVGISYMDEWCSNHSHDDLK